MPSTNPRVQWSAAEEIDRVIASGVRFGCVLADCHSSRRVEPAPFMKSDNCRARGYEVDIIVTWEMTVTPAKRVASPILSRLRQRGGALGEANSLAGLTRRLRRLAGPAT